MLLARPTRDHQVAVHLLKPLHPPPRRQVLDNLLYMTPAAPTLPHIFARRFNPVPRRSKPNRVHAARPQRSRHLPQVPHHCRIALQVADRVDEAKRKVRPRQFRRESPHVRHDDPVPAPRANSLSRIRHHRRRSIKPKHPPPPPRRHPQIPPRPARGLQPYSRTCPGCKQPGDALQPVNFIRRARSVEDVVHPRVFVKAFCHRARTLSASGAARPDTLPS